MLEQRRTILGLGLIVAVACLVSLLVAPPLLVRADDPPPRPQLGTPPAPTATPSTDPNLPPRPPIRPPDPTRTSPRVGDGAAIELNVQFLAGSPSSVEWRKGLWTLVQWQDGLGAWHDVHGWRGTLDEVNGDEGKKVWYLAKDRLGEGTFSWVVYSDSEGDELIARSAPFNLPANKGQTRHVKMAIGPLPDSTSKSKGSALPPTGGGQHPGLWKFLTVGLVVLLAIQLLPLRDRWFR